MRWGLVPFWAKDLKVGFANINAKAEGIEGKPAFREAFQRRRCLVPVDNYRSQQDREITINTVLDDLMAAAGDPRNAQPLKLDA